MAMVVHDRPDSIISDGLIAHGTWQQVLGQWDVALQSYRTTGRVLLIPPDMSRLGTGAGVFTAVAYARLSHHATVDVMPALGTHAPMTASQLTTMFGTAIPSTAFLTHNYQTDIEQIGTVSAKELRQLLELSSNAPLVGLNQHNLLPITLNRSLINTSYQHIISIGTVAPHVIVGFSNHCKNILIGCGGSELLAVTHYYGARIGVNHIIATIDNPIRRLLNYVYDTFCSQLPIGFALLVSTDTTSISPNSPVNATPTSSNSSTDVAPILPLTLSDQLPITASMPPSPSPHAPPATAPHRQATVLPHPALQPNIQVAVPQSDIHHPDTAAVYWSSSTASFDTAAQHAHATAVIRIAHHYHTVVAYMPAQQYTSLWVANKAIYRLNQLVADDGTLIIIAPGVATIADPSQYRRVVQQYGYRNTERIINRTEHHTDPLLTENLAAAAHCIHADTAGRYRICYATPAVFAPTLRAVGFTYLPLSTADRYLTAPQRTNPSFATGHYHTADGTPYYFTANIGVRCWKVVS